MSPSAVMNVGRNEVLERIETNVRRRLAGRLGSLHLELDEDGLVMRGRVHSYYSKQLAQHAVMECTDLPIHANEIESFAPQRRIWGRPTQWERRS
jgi:hypothetical protein